MADHDAESASEVVLFNLLDATMQDLNGQLDKLILQYRTRFRASSSAPPVYNGVQRRMARYGMTNASREVEKADGEKKRRQGGGRPGGVGDWIDWGFGLTQPDRSSMPPWRRQEQLTSVGITRAKIRHLPFDAAATARGAGMRSAWRPLPVVQLLAFLGLRPQAALIWAAATTSR